MRFAARRSAQLTVGLLGAFGLLTYSVLGLVIFAGFTMFDLQRLRSTRQEDLASAPFLAASIFLDVLNVFLFFLEIFSGSQRD